MKRILAITALLAAFGAAAQEKAIDARVTVKASAADVFKAWTTSEGIRTFFAPDANVQLRVDGPFEIFMNPLAQPGMKGADGMRILAFQQDRMLSFTWNAPPNLPEARAQRTVVIVRMKPLSDTETDVTLHHVGWGEGGEWDKTYEYFSKAWPGVLGSLNKRFETGPLDFTEWMTRMREGMEKAKKEAEEKAAAEKK
jgi:uncharacterized protein YndB with AHSA1/START domain